MKCFKCGFENEPGAKYCNKCGSKIETKKIYCFKCGTELKPESKFCSKCGTKITNNGKDKHKFINWKFFWLTFPLAIILVLGITYADLTNFINPTNSLNFTSSSYNQSSDLSGRFILYFINLLFVTIIERTLSKRLERDNLWKFIAAIFVITNIVILVELLRIIIFIICENDCGKLYKILIFIYVVINIIINCFSIVHFSSSKMSLPVCRKADGGIFAFLLATTLFGGVYLCEESAGNKTYSDQVIYNRQVKIVDTVKQLKKIFSNCQVKIDGEQAVDYTNCNFHFVNNDGSKVNFQDLKMDGNVTNLNLTFGVYMDNYNVYQYHNDVIDEDAVDDIIGSHKDFKKGKYFTITFDMSQTGNIKIQVDPLNGLPEDFELFNDGPSLDGTLNLNDMNSTQASFTTSDSN